MVIGPLYSYEKFIYWSEQRSHYLQFTLILLELVARTWFLVDEISIHTMQN